MPTRLSAVLFAFLLPVAGCLEVESMEVRVVADSKNDRLDIMIVSRGVWSSARDDSELASDLAKLRKCREVAAVPVPGLGVMDFTAPADDAAAAQRWRELVPFLEIEAGAFFTDEQGRLSFYQFLRVHRPRQFAAACSRIAREAMLAEKKISPATRALLEKAANEEWPMVIIDGAGFAFRRPLADEDHRKERAEFARDIERSLEREAKKAERENGARGSLVRTLLDNDVAIVRREGVTEYLIGTQGSEVCDYVLPGQAYEDDLMKEFTKDEPRPPAVTQAIIDKQFAAFHAREARLPPAFAEQKKRAQQPAGR